MIGLGRRSGLSLALGVLVAGLAACTQPEAPPDRFYRVTVTSPETSASAPRFTGSLEVERPDAEGLLTGRPVIAVSGVPGEPMTEYPYDFWEKAPALLMRDALVECMDGAAIADRVVTEQTGVSADYSLTGRLIRFERIESSPPRALIEIQIGLRENFRDDLLLWEMYEEVQDARDGEMPATVNAFDEAFSKICRRVVADLNAVSLPKKGR